MAEQFNPRPGPSSGRRKRTAKASNTQLEHLLGLLEARPFLFTRRFSGLQGRENFEAGWKEATKELNDIPSGSCKTPEQWLTVWRDMKSRACSKAAKLRKERAQTGNRGVTTAPLTEVEKRVISLVGVEYTLGTDCPESMPEEATVQQQLEAGVNMEELIRIPPTQDVQELREEHKIVEVQETPTDQKEESDSPISLSQITFRQAPPKRVDRRVRNRNLNPRLSVAEQNSAARKDFLAIAKSNAESMRILAAATQMQAEASKSQVELAKAQVEATKAQTEAFLLFAAATAKLADAVTNLVNK